MLLYLVARQAWPSVKAHHPIKAFKSTVWILVPFAAIAALPALHNLYFGGQLVLLQTSLASSYILTPAALLQVGTNAGVTQSLAYQLGGVLASETDLTASVSGSYLATVRLIQVGLACALLLGALHLFKRPWSAVLLTAVPTSFLAAHLFVQVDVYYPRHIVLGYAIGSLTLLALGGVLLGRGRWTVHSDEANFGISHSDAQPTFYR
jgi:hypothetical protein